MARWGVDLCFSVDKIPFTGPSPLPAAFQNFKIPDKTTRKLLTICHFLKRQNQFLKFMLRSGLPQLCKYLSRAIRMLVFLTKGRKSLKFGKGGNADTANSDLEQSLLFCSQRVCFSCLPILICLLDGHSCVETGKLNQVLETLLWGAFVLSNQIHCRVESWHLC